MIDKTICRGCSFDPPCKTKADMRSRHGFPSEQRAGITAAFVDGFVTLDEAEAGIRQYQEDYNGAPPE